MSERETGERERLVEERFDSQPFDLQREARRKGLFGVSALISHLLCSTWTSTSLLSDSIKKLLRIFSILDIEESKSRWATEFMRC